MFVLPYASITISISLQLPRVTGLGSGNAEYDTKKSFDLVI